MQRIDQPQPNRPVTRAAVRPGVPGSKESRPPLGATRRPELGPAEPTRSERSWIRAGFKALPAYSREALRTDLELFAAASPGLEPFVREELESLAVRDPQAEPGGVGFRGSLEEIARINRNCKTALFVSWVLGRFRARRFPELLRKARALPWASVVAPGYPIEVRASCRRSRLIHGKAVAERVEEAISAQVPGASVGRNTERSDEEPLRVRVRFEDDEARISVDTSGRPLPQRCPGWETAHAPLRADIAQVMFRLGGQDAPCVLDPLCGSGTLPIEAACTAATTFAVRSYAFEAFPAWREARVAEPGAPASKTPGRFPAALSRPTPSPSQALALPHPSAAGGTGLEDARFRGADRDSDAVAAATRNAARAGVSVRFDVASLSETLDPATLPRAGLLMTNPPYGQRLSAARDLTPLYRALGDGVRRLGAGWRVVLVAPDPRWARATGLPLRRCATADHGGRRVSLWVSEHWAAGLNLPASGS